MYIYSCHDSTLVGLLGTLDVYDFKWPPFGSYVILETYENKEQQKYVRVSYNGKVGISPCSSEMFCAMLKSLFLRNVLCYVKVPVPQKCFVLC